MHVRFWGTRGSIPKPGPSTLRYGGNTACVEVRTERGTLVIIDGGTGLHGIGQSLMADREKGLVGHVLISHTHWDHIQGIPFFAPFFVPGNNWHIYGPKGLDKSLRETLAGQMQHTYFPIAPEQFGASIHYHDLLEGTFEIDEIRIATRYLNHPALTLGYRLEADGATLVYSSDHEPFSRIAAEGLEEFTGQDLGHADFVRGADLLIHDAQYTAAEYLAKIGWGHSSVEFVARLAQRSNVKAVALIHHDPLRTDDDLDRIVEDLRMDLREDGSPLEIRAAAEGSIQQVRSSKAPQKLREEAQSDAMSALEAPLSDRTAILSVTSAHLSEALTEAIRAEGVGVDIFSTPDEGRKLVAKHRPSIAFVEFDCNEAYTKSLCHSARGQGESEVPIVLVAERENVAFGSAAGACDWLIAPFSSSYARTKIRAWILRTTCRWKPAPIPEDEPLRLASLLKLGLLDTQPDERFDRITRLAAALFDVPMVTITLVDSDRQWFKSCVGVEERQNSRDVSFCAHVVHDRRPMVVPDTLSDDRFAENPLVVGGPRLRFYAGYPLLLDDGNCIGTLCLLDTRPRMMDGSGLERLKDLANIILQEIRGLAQS